MSTVARVKSPEFMYHVMCRSISEFNLYRDDEDKLVYLRLLKKYCEKFQSYVYSYCIMDNHCHLHLDLRGADISKFMQGLNLSYAYYYNVKYKRHGHVFQGRFQSSVVSSDSYNLNVSAYIHNNPKDIEHYVGREFEYPFSSFGFYMGIRKDFMNLVNTDYILRLFNSKIKPEAVKQYVSFVTKQKNITGDKSITKCLSRFSTNEYRCERVVLFRDFKPEDIFARISKALGFKSIDSLNLKFNRATSKLRAFSAFVLRSLCGFSYKEICKTIGNITLSASSRLCANGYHLFKTEEKYEKIFHDIVELN